jgi:hypothetical protein
MMHRITAPLAAAALLVCALPSVAQVPTPGTPPGAHATPAAAASTGPLSTPLPSLPPAPSGALTPSPQAPVPAPSAAQGALLRFTGQLLDLRNGYVFFTTGDAFKIAPTLRIADYDTGKPTTLQPQPKLFARAIVDRTSRDVVELDLTRRRLPPDAAYAAVQGFATVKSTLAPNPELGAGRPLTGREVPVAFSIEVPPSTPLDASVYISTDVSQWNPEAVKLDRVDATHYRTVIRYPSGTRLSYKITRGSWQTEETDERGMEAAPHHLVIQEIDSQIQRIVVYHWADERGTGMVPVSPGAIPTPFNPNPFPQGGIFPGGGTQPAGAQPITNPCPPNLPNCH